MGDVVSTMCLVSFTKYDGVFPRRLSDERSLRGMPALIR